MVVSALLLLAVSVGPRFLDVGFRQLSPFCVMMASRRRVPRVDKCMGRDGKDKIRAKQHRGRMEWEGYHTWLVTQGMLEGDGVPSVLCCACWGLTSCLGVVLLLRAVHSQQRG